MNIGIVKLLQSVFLNASAWEQQERKKIDMLLLYLRWKMDNVIQLTQKKHLIKKWKIINPPV